MVRRARPLAAALSLAACTTQPAQPPRPARVPVAVAAVTAAPAPAVVPTSPPVIATTPPAVPAPLACLTRYYDATARHDAGGWSLVLPDGPAIPYDDGQAKDAYQRFVSPDVKDVYELRYPHGPIRPITQVDFDPGRVRIDPLMSATYGKSAKEVAASLVSVRVGGRVFRVHRKVAAPLRRVAARVAAAMKRDPSLARFFQSPGGTFNWRKIAGTDTLSMHAWGIAIDLDTRRADYWRNQTTRDDAPLVWKNRYPQAIVDAFEAEGFIWGGRWYHFDTMHFEYRPELLDPACYPR